MHVKKQIKGFIRVSSWVKKSEASQAARVSFRGGGKDSVVTAARSSFCKTVKISTESI